MCAICLVESNGKGHNNFKKLGCGHEFHNECILQWYISKKINIDVPCPLCRTLIKIPYIFSKSLNYNSQQHYKFINNGKLSSTKNILYNQNSAPAAWITLYINNEKQFQPVYPMINELIDNESNEDIEKNETYLTFYSRMTILYGKTEIFKLIEKTPLNDYKYYDTNEIIFGDMSKCVFIICYEWLYDVMFELKYSYDLEYDSILNTLICDIMFITIKHFREESSKKIFQGILACSIHNCINFYEKINIPFNKINYYTDKAYTIEELQKYNDFQSEYLQKNLILN